MQTIRITVDASRIATVPKGTAILCDNSDVKIEFDIAADSGFDTEEPINAIFATARGVYPPIVFSHGCVTAPAFSYEDSCLVYVGISQGDIKTSSPAEVLLLHSARSVAFGKEANPDPGDRNLPIVREVTLDDLVRISDVEHGRQVLITLENLSAVIGGGSTDAVLYTEQELTAAQKATARENIGAGVDTTFTLEVRQDYEGSTPLDTYSITTPYADFATAYAAGNMIRVHVVDMDNNIYLSDPYMYGDYFIATGTIPVAQNGVAGATVVFYTLIDNDSWEAVSVNYLAYPTVAALANKYTLPVGGIPKTDLDSSVQSSLAKADAAVRYNEQTLTDAQKIQARENIGAASLDDIGTVFSIKGDVATVADLPATGNAVGDVWYVQAVSAGYVWLETNEHPTGYWEELGEPIDLSAYRTAAEQDAIDATKADKPFIAAFTQAANETWSMTTSYADWTAAKNAGRELWLSLTFANASTVLVKSYLGQMTFAGVTYAAFGTTVPALTAGNLSTMSGNFVFFAFVDDEQMYNTTLFKSVVMARASDLAAKQDKGFVTTLTIAASDWVNGSCTKTVPGMTATALGWVEYSDTETSFTEAQGTNTLTFTADPVPSEAVTVKVGWFNNVEVVS